MADAETMSIFDAELTEDEEAHLDARADAEIEAGHGIPHAVVRTWVESWGKPDELPCPLPPG